MASEAPGQRSMVTDPRLLSVLSVTAVAVFSNQAAPVAIPGISSSLAVSDARVGLVMTAFFLPSSVMLLVVGSLADIHGRRRIVLPSLAVSDGTVAIAGNARLAAGALASVVAWRTEDILATIVAGVGALLALQLLL